MTMGNMRSLGVRSILVTCTPCGHTGQVNCDRWPDHLPTPDVELHLRCSRCGAKEVTSIIDVGEMYADHERRKAETRNGG